MTSPPLFVPVHPTRHGTLALHTGRLPSGQRTGLAFSWAASLTAVLGPGQPWTRLSEHALREMLTPLGIQQLRLDPHPVREPAPSTPPARVPPAQRHQARRRRRVHRFSTGGRRPLTA